MKEDFEFEQSQKYAELFKFLSRLLRNWYWVVASVLIAATVAYLIMRYEDPIHVVHASFITKKFDEGASGGIAGIIDQSIFKQRIEVYQEIPLLKSEDKIRETLNRLDFGISYYVEGRFKTSEVFGDFYFDVQVDSQSTNVPYGTPIYIRTESNNQYTLDTENVGLKNRFANQTFSFGRSYNLQGWQFKIGKNKSIQKENGYAYYFIINNPQDLLNEYRNKLQISWQQQGSAILDANIRSAIPEKDYKFINTYLDVVIEKGLEEKNQYLINTIDFINDYMGQLSDTLIKYQNRIDNFRLNNREVISGSDLVFDRLKELDIEKTNLLLENRYYDYIKKYVKQQKYEEVFAPNLINIQAQVLEELLNEYMEVKWDDKVDLNTENSKNPLVNKSNEEIVRLEKNIYESIRSGKEANQREINEIDEKINFYYSTLSDFQVESRQYDEMQRMLSLYENSIDVLLSKRTDASIAKASTTSDYQIVTSPTYSNQPVYPDRDKVYAIALFIGFGLPIGIIYLMTALNEKIVTKEDLHKSTNIPLIGSIGHSGLGTDKVLLEKPKSNISEAFRGIRANLQYFTQGQPASKVFLITSSISSEGKTFCSINLAYTYSLTGKKTILLGADLRKPSLSKKFDLKGKVGLSHYLADLDTLENGIYPTEKDNLFILPAGIVPPNPAELLSSRKMDEAIHYLKQHYDVIIIDTPPIGLVADTLELIKHADTNLLIVRQSQTYKKSLLAITELYNEGKVQNLGILFNDIDFRKYEYGKGYGGYRNKYGYSYGYGYGYYEEMPSKKRGWLSRLLKRT